MKKMFKRVICVIAAAALCVSVVSGCNKNTAGSEELLFYVVGSEKADTERVIAKANEIIKANTGYSINFQFVSNDSYDMIISSGEEYDLIYAPDHMNYWNNAAKGAFMEITDEDLKKHAPYIWENGGDSLNSAKLGGVRYGISKMLFQGTDKCTVARGDLMEKYGIEDLDSVEAIEEYLTAVKENEPDMIPLDLPGTQPYSLLALFAVDWGWCPVGSLSYGEQVYFRADDPEHKLFIAAEQPEMLEFTKTMKRWNEKGFFSKSVLSNKTDINESFKSGRTALGFLGDRNACQDLWNEIKNDERAAWDVRFFSRYQTRQQVYGYNNNMVAIGATSKNKEAALKVINEMFENEELYRVINYGFEGEHYNLNEDGTYTTTDAAENLGYIATGVTNEAWMLKKELNFPGSEELVKKLDDFRVYNPAVNCPVSNENVREIKVALQEVYNQYTTPRMYGAFVGSAEEAIAKELEQLKKAGIDDYVADLQAQLDAYMEGIGE